MLLLFAGFVFSSPLEELKQLQEEVQISIQDLQNTSASLNYSQESLQNFEARLIALNNRLQILEQSISDYQEKFNELENLLKAIREEYQQLLQDWKRYQRDLSIWKTISITSGSVALLCLISLALILLK